MENVIVAVVLFPMVLLNVLMNQGKAMGARLGRLAGGLVPEEEVAAPDVEALRKRMTRILNLVKLGVTLLGLALGIYALTSGGEKVSLATVSMVIAAALAFRNGAELSRMVVYARHDAGVIRSRSGDIPAGGLLTRILAVGIFANALFIALWAVLFFVVQAGVKSAAGLDVNQWAIILWAAGLAVGLCLSLAAAWLVETCRPLLTVTITWYWVAIAACVSLVGSVLSALYPAWLATRVDIVEALSFE